MMETDMVAILKAICPRSYPDVAPPNTPTPYITWQIIGGESLRYSDNTAPDKRNSLVQVNVWSKTRLEALTMIRQIEDAICAASWQAEPSGEARSTYESDTLLYGSSQDFDIWATR